MKLLGHRQGILVPLELLDGLVALFVPAKRLEEVEKPLEILGRTDPPPPFRSLPPLISAPSL